MTHEERNAKQRIKRKLDGNLSTHKYEKTPKGFLMRKYRNMQSRTCGIQWKKSHLYLGKELLSREEFYAWAFHSDDFNRMYIEWVESGYDMKLCPTVDRIDSSYGYTLDNMRWLTHSENSRLGSIHSNLIRRLKRNEKDN